MGAVNKLFAIAAAVALGSTGRTFAMTSSMASLEGPPPCRADVCGRIGSQNRLAHVLGQLISERAGNFRSGRPPADRGRLQSRPLSPKQLATLISSCAPASPATLIRSLALTESGGHVLRIAINGASRRVFSPAGMIEAAATLTTLSRQGANFDIGLMQLNSATLRRMNVPLTAALDPCRNLAIGAQIFDQAYATAFARRAPTSPLWSASSIYNTGDPLRGLRNGYAGRVQAVLHTSTQTAG